MSLLLSLLQQGLGAWSRNEVLLRKFLRSPWLETLLLRLKRPSCVLLATALLSFNVLNGYGQEQSPVTAADGAPAPIGASGIAVPSQATRAAAELKAEEQQRILGVVPDFNVTSLKNAAPLNPGQKFQLALKSAVDPFAFMAAGLDAGLSQWERDAPGYGLGAEGYAKRFESAYLDSFDGAILGNAVFPILLHQDPRYFRQGTGTFGSRFRHAIASTYRCKNDNGTWTWNYSNILGNIAAGGIANAYYAPSDRGAGLTFERSVTVTAEGAIGAIFYEFWPDLSRKLLTRKKKQPQG